MSARARQASVFLVLGPPGVGKASLGQALYDEIDARILSASQILEREAGANWLTAQGLIEREPNQELLDVLYEAYESAAAVPGIVILDGYPCTRGQLAHFHQRGGGLEGVIELHAPPDATADPLQNSDDKARPPIRREVQHASRVRSELEALKALLADEFPGVHVLSLNVQRFNPAQVRSYARSWILAQGAQGCVPLQRLSREFHDFFRIDQEAMRTGVDGWDVRRRIMTEEFGEVLAALSSRDIKSLAQELADVVYVCFGTAVTFGIDLERMVHAVHYHNLEKLNDQGEPSVDASGKVVKPPDYIPLDPAEFV